MVDIKKLEEELEKFKYQEDAILSDSEMELLRKAMSDKDTFNTFFKFFLGVESEKGISLAYDIESLPTEEDGMDAKTIAENARFHKMLTRFVRSKLDHLQLLIKTEIEKDIKEAKEKLAEKEIKREEEKKKEELEEKGVGENL